jgi:small subunit ribosomal protein S16
VLPAEASVPAPNGTLALAGSFPPLFNDARAAFRLVTSAATGEKFKKQRLPSAPLATTLWLLFLGNLWRLQSVVAAATLLFCYLFMAVKIRMKRVGAKNAPVFRIVIADGRSPRDGKFIEEIGTYQPRKKGDNFTLDLERTKYWLSKGAQPSDTVASFIKKANKAAAASAAA